MALKSILESLDGLPEAIQKEYKPGEGDLSGKFVLDVEAVENLSLANVAKLQSALSAERELHRKAKEKIEQFADLDPTKARDAIKKVEEMASWTPEQKVKEQIDAVKTQLLDSHGKEKTKLEAKLASMTKSLEGALITSVASQALAEQKGSVKLLMPHIERQTRLREVDGKYSVEVIGPDGNPRLCGADAHAMSISELVTEMKSQKDFASAFEGSGASGTGAGGNGGKGGAGSGQKNPWKKETLNITEQFTIMRDDPQLAETLKAEAGVA